MKITGGCHCGNIRYEAEVDPDRAMICHCADCQRISGSAYRPILPVSEDSFTLVSGEPKSYVKTADSGNLRPQNFCAECGSHFYATSMDPYPRMFNIRLGTVDQRDQLPPRKQIWTRSAQPWAANIEELPGLEEQS